MDSQTQDKGIDFGQKNEINIQGDVVAGNKYTGYTREEVSLLLSQIEETFQPKPFDGGCPYMGLSVFQEEDALRFFGREQLITQLVERLNKARFICVAGPSGSGKSSLIRAGLLPMLKADKLPYSASWLYQSLTPNNNPVEQLALAMSRVARSPDAARYLRRYGIDDLNTLHHLAESLLNDRPTQRLVLFVDQFEELFTLVNTENERTIFLNLLTSAAAYPDGRVIILIAIRSDFISRCTLYPQLITLMNEQFQLVGAMQPDGLVSAIYRPAVQVGLKVEPALIEHIIQDMKGEPGALPLMQFALKDLFDAQEAKGGIIALTNADYIAHGGLHKALARHADAAFAKLNPQEQKLARDIFAGLVKVGHNDVDTRYRAIFSELVPVGEDTERVEVVINALSAARLLITDSEVRVRTVTLIHEALIEAWPWLRKLVDENRESIALLNQISEDAREWNEHGRDPSYLYSGGRLETARERVGDHKISLSGLAETFVRRGIEVRDEAQRQQEEKRRYELHVARRQVMIFAGIGLITTLFAIVSFLFYREASYQRRLTLARQLAAQAIAYTPDRLDLALLLSMAAYQIDDSFESKRSLLTVLQSSPRLITFLHAHTRAVHTVAFSPDSKMLASAGFDQMIQLWDPWTFQSLGTLSAKHKGMINALAFSPDGKVLAAAGDDPKITLWDITTQQLIDEWSGGNVAGVYALAFHPDGSLLASSGCAQMEASLEGCNSGEIRLWNPTTHSLVGSPLLGHTSTIRSIAFSPDGKTLASGGDDARLILWDLITRQPRRQPLIGHSDWVRTIAFSPDTEEPKLVSGSYDGTFIVWDPITGKALDTATSKDKSPVLSTAFNGDGTLLAVGSSGKTIGLWSVGTVLSDAKLLQAQATLTGHAAAVSSVAFSTGKPESTILASGGNDSNVILWDIYHNQRLGKQIGSSSNKVWALDMSANGKTLVVSYCQDFVNVEIGNCLHGEVRLWDVGTATVRQLLTGTIGSKQSAVLSPDGKWLAIGGCAEETRTVNHCETGEIRLWSVIAGQAIGTPFLLHGHKNWVLSLLFSPDSQTLVSSSSDQTILLWNVAERRLLGEPLTEHKGAVWSLAFNQHGTLFASGSSDNTVIIWDITTHRPLYPPFSGHNGWVWALAFSPDGTMLASGGTDNLVLLWEVATGKQMGRALTGHARAVNTVSFSLDSRILVSGGGDSAIIFWDVVNHERLGQSFLGHTNGVSSLTFNNNGMQLVSGGLDGALIFWDATLAAWLKHACIITNRGLTTSEWNQFVGTNVADNNICH